MLKISKTINVHGTSSITSIEGGDTVVAQMNANISTESKGTVNINTSVINTELYFANKIAVDRDIEEFNNYVYLLIEGGMNNE